ncbi:MAG: CbiX/SirB N-terminal domain-containing protein [Zoogloeaceae bacterium]|jgi:sirohydrochlorin cobaltochelatase|nr:CbiX/SirB N-terminal domain-containing protein [Zoogloeaceae bacterium]
MSASISLSPALILLGHGARDPEWAAPLLTVRDQVRATHPACRVETAFLEFMSPDLASRVAELAQANIQTITVLPMFIAQGAHLKKKLPLQVTRLQREYPTLKLALAPAIGTADQVLAAMSAQASRCLFP